MATIIHSSTTVQMILSERPKFQLPYQELDSIIQTLSNFHQHHHHDPEKVRNLKKRFKDVAKEAQGTFDLYLYAINFRHSIYSLRSHVPETSLDLENVMRSIESIKVEFMTIDIHNIKMDSSPRIDTLKTHSAADAAGTSTSSTRTRKPLTETVVGLDRDAAIIRDKLLEDTKQLSVVSIVGMGGLGKTTLATKLFNDPFIKYHFHIHAWATVSQTYRRRDLLIQILVSIGVLEGLDQASDSQLRQMLHQNLMRRKYLIVIDDIWSIEAWNELNMFFPDDNTASRILLTSRLNKVASHVKLHGFVHSLPYLTEEESWELLKQKVFHGDECPEWLIKPGMQIAKKCHGLPLSVVVMAGVLAKESMNEALWKNIAYSVHAYIVSDQKGCLETLALSYHHLPDHLRECLLYLGGFPEDFTFNVERLIWLWMAEGFIEEAGNRSLEDTAKAYLMDIVNRNLVIVAKRNEMGEVKACKLHDLVRELCLQKAKQKKFFLKIDSLPLSSSLLEGIRYKQLRVFTHEDADIVDLTCFTNETIRSVLCFHTHMRSIDYIEVSFLLLRVLDLQKCRFHDFRQGLPLLVHLRYLAIWCASEFPEPICKLWSLQTLIIQTDANRSMDLPCNITDLVNLKHLWSNSLLYLPYIEKPMNLHSISKVMLKDGIDNFQKCFPYIKRLVLYCAVDFQEYSEKRLELLPYLENLKLMGPGFQQRHIWFPATLKKLTLAMSSLRWSHMSIIQLLTNLEVLKLQDDFFMTGRRWDAREQHFRQLKLLILRNLNIKYWEASITSFPCLKQLSLSGCYNLEEVPFDIGETTTLELIETDSSSNSVVKSVKRIQDNYELKATVDGMELSDYLSQCEEHKDSETE